MSSDTCTFDATLNLHAPCRLTRAHSMPPSTLNPDFAYVPARPSLRVSDPSSSSWMFNMITLSPDAMQSEYVCTRPVRALTLSPPGNIIYVSVQLVLTFHSETVTTNDKWAGIGPTTN